MTGDHDAVRELFAALLNIPTVVFDMDSPAHVAVGIKAFVDAYCSGYLPHEDVPPAVFHYVLSQTKGYIEHIEAQPNVPRSRRKKLSENQKAMMMVEALAKMADDPDNKTTRRKIRSIAKKHFPKAERDSIRRRDEPKK